MTSQENSRPFQAGILFGSLVVAVGILVAGVHFLGVPGGMVAFTAVLFGSALLVD